MLLQIIKNRFFIMFKYFLYIIFIFSVNKNAFSNEKFFDIVNKEINSANIPYNTEVPKDNLLLIIGIPIPKPGVEITSVDKDGNESVEIQISKNYFSTLSADLLSQLPCIPTPHLNHKIKFENITKNRSNNLRRKTGSPDIASGHILYIKGFVRDINCMPVRNANIELSHLNAYGVLNSKIEKNNPKYDPFFLESGSTVTDNRGYFEFITIFPGENKSNNTAPYVNFLITHKNFDDFQTQIFFPDHYLNPSDYRLKNIPELYLPELMGRIFPINENNIEEGFIMGVDLVVNVSNFY